MKAAWIRNFWTKTVAFLLAAALVPVILTYVVGLAYSYAVWVGTFTRAPSA